MIKLFKFKRNEDNLISSEVVHSALITIWMNTYGRYFKDQDSLSNKKLREIHKAENVIKERLRKLEYLGLRNSLNYKNLQSLIANKSFTDYGKEAYEFVKGLRKLSPDIIVIPHENYIDLLNKYNLVTGKLDNFTGLIPDDKLKELINISDSLDINYDLLEKGEVNNIKPIIEIGINNTYKSRIVFKNDITEVIRKINIFPFYKNINDYKIRLINSDESSSKLFFNDIINLRGSSIPLRVDEWLISCSRNLISTVPVTEYIPEPSAPKVVDPILIKYCKYGFIVGPRWGEEGMDIMFEKMKKFLDSAFES